jgi:hypothetical protein
MGIGDKIILSGNKINTFIHLSHKELLFPDMPDGIEFAIFR